jgi:two-component system chemotaxis sensor kinase CheA
VTCLQACLRADDRSHLIGQLDAVAQQALASASARPLAAWMERTFVPPAAVPPEAGPGDPEPVATEDPGPKAAGSSDHGAASRILKVDQTKIDRLMDLIGEMVVAKNAIPYLANRAETVYGTRELSREIKTHYAVINRISEEMQDAIMQVRMMPVSFVFQRFPRLVRDTSRRIGKEVRLVLEGQDTAADKNIIEALGDPLIHILRNSLDHGLETPDIRSAAG